MKLNKHLKILKSKKDDFFLKATLDLFLKLKINLKVKSSLNEV